MKKLLLIALSTFTATAAVSANAWEPSFYVGGGASAWQYDQSNLDSNFSITAIEGVAGIKVFKYLAVEARVGTGLNTGRERERWLIEDNETTEGVDESSWADELAEVEMPYYASIYFKPEVSNDKASLYGLIGYTSTALDTFYELEYSNDDYADTSSASDDTHSDVSYGIGVSFVMTPQVNLTAEWKKMIKADEFDIQGGTIGFTYSF